MDVFEQAEMLAERREMAVLAKGQDTHCFICGQNHPKGDAHIFAPRDRQIVEPEKSAPAIDVPRRGRPRKA